MKCVCVTARNPHDKQRAANPQAETGAHCQECMAVSCLAKMDKLTQGRGQELKTY